MTNFARSFTPLALLPITMMLAGCTGGPNSVRLTSPDAAVNLVVTPGAALSLSASSTVQLRVTNNGAPENVNWTLQGSSNSAGSVTVAGLYTAPAEVGSANVAELTGTSTTHPGTVVSVEITLTNPTPTITSLYPASAATYTPYVGLVNGANFTPGSIVMVNGSSVPSTFVSSNSLQFSLPTINPSTMAPAIQVVTSLPGGGTTASLSLPVAAGGVSYDAAVRFLNQASWGATPSTIAHVRAIGFSAYLDEQLALPVDTLVTDADYQHFYENLWQNGLYKPSQLRQRMMWAWYKMFNTPGSTDLAWASAVPEQLQRDAFANFTTLLLHASLNTANGVALNTLANDAGPNPNQNFGRELLQLFSTGPALLHQDGTPVLQVDETPAPVYTQTDVSEAARAMTGWNGSATWDAGTDPEGLDPMLENPGSWAHDRNPKTILGATIGGGAGALSDMTTVVTLAANHPNTAPFMTLRLIRSFVTSNPSPDYVSRVTAVWSDDGKGSRGNLAAVIKAILLDPEARANDDSTSEIGATSGRVMDAIEFQMNANRILGTSNQVVWWSRQTACEMNECALSAPSVFGYYKTAYMIPGTRTLAPELSLFTTATLQVKADYLSQVIYPPADSNNSNISIDWSVWSNLAGGDGTALVDQLNHTCLHGTMSVGLRQVLMQAYQQSPADSNNVKAKELMYLTLMSPEFGVSR